jgi:hypothetical protein
LHYIASKKVIKNNELERTWNKRAVAEFKGVSIFQEDIGTQEITQDNQFPVELRKRNL